MKNNILKAVGGLEAAQKIVDSAPDVAVYYRSSNETYYKFQECKGWFYSHLYEGWSTYPDLYNELKASENLIKLTDLRSAIAETRMHSAVAEVEQFEKNKNQLIYGKSTSDELGQNPICIEEEPLNLFQSKHCSPRLLEHMKFDVSVVPVSKQGCTACATKDHDLKALRKLQASNLSIYAGRVHSQQTSIMIREIIIVMLIVVCIALFLWGLRLQSTIHTTFYLRATAHCSGTLMFSN